MLRLSILFAASLLTVPLTATAPRGYQVRDAVVRSDAAGARIHGRICRQTLAPPPTEVRADHLGADGQVLGSATHSLSGLNGRDSACTVFDLPTNWTVAAGEAVRVCALRSQGACATP
jgi:hypothetical protein